MPCHQILQRLSAAAEDTSPRNLGTVTNVGGLQTSLIIYITNVLEDKKKKKNSSVL